MLHAGAREILIGAENVPDRAALRRALLREFRDQVECSSGLGLVSVIGAAVGESRLSVGRTQDVLSGRGLRPLEMFARPLSLTSVLEGPAVRQANLALHDEFIAKAVPA